MSRTLAENLPGLLLLCLGIVLCFPVKISWIMSMKPDSIRFAVLHAPLRDFAHSLRLNFSESIIVTHPRQVLGGVSVLCGLAWVLETQSARKNENRINSQQRLDQVYNGPIPKIAITKETDHIHPAYQKFIEASPFMILATSGPGGLDASPRGDPQGVVRILDKKTLILPDVRGNNRIDSLHNIIKNPEVAMLFLIPGVCETIRARGTAEIVVDEQLLLRYKVGKLVPKSLIKITVKSMFIHCSQSVSRSGIWSQDKIANIPTLPSAREMVSSLVG